MQRMHTTVVAIAARVAVAAATIAIAASAAHAATIDVTVTNGAAREITGLYAAATAQSKWGPDQLNGVSMLQGDALTLRVTCDQTSIVLVAEDVAGCFAYQTIGCGSGGAWTLTSSTTRDCGR